MTDEEIKQTIAQNIAQYRKKLGLTQFELSEKINYSDKSISKWERGEGIPDAMTLIRLSEVFGVTVNDLIAPQAEKAEIEPKTVDSTASRFTWKHYFITLLSVGGVWLAAFLTICFFQFLAPEIAAVWNSRVLCYAAPACFVVWLVLAVLWWPYVWRFICITGIIWFTAVSLHVTFPISGIGVVYLVAGVLQILLTFCYLWKCAAEHRILRLSLFPKG